MHAGTYPRAGVTAPRAESALGVVTMSVHKLTAGSGYDYLTRQVAALDATEKGHTGLASYYAERGESPGVWIGSGMDGIDGLAAGDPVAAEQMRALFGCGLHPLAELRQQQLEGADLTTQDFQNVARLGAPFRIVDNDLCPFRVEVARRIAALNTAIGCPADASVAAADRARVRTQVAREFFRAEHGREPVDARELTGQIAKDSRPRTQTVAGYDLTFSPVKSVSTLWAVADPAVAAVIERAHQAAVRDALSFIEQYALFTRTGPQGIRQVDVRGLVATAFTHRDSRAGDPDLHTHVAVANKVQTLDGRWLSIDGRVLFKANVAASEAYNTALEQHLRDSLGVRFAERPGADPAKRPIREIVGVDPRLNQRWSTRRAHINTRRGELAIQFQQDHGRPPTPVEALHLAQQATLETRDAKHEPRSWAEQRATWLNEAAAVLDGPEAVAAMVQTALTPAAETATIADAHWVAQTADHILAVMEKGRSTWQMWHVRAEANAKSAPRPCPSSGRVPWWICWSMRYWIAGLSRWPHRLTASMNRMRYAGSTDRRSTPWPVPTCTRRNGSSTRNGAWSSPQDAATDQRLTSRWWTWLCWRWRRTGRPWIPGRQRWSGRCAPRVPGYS
jgi:conjugative relaxase-like TrwC/TraI family protein